MEQFAPLIHDRHSVLHLSFMYITMLNIFNVTIEIFLVVSKTVRLIDLMIFLKFYELSGQFFLENKIIYEFNDTK